MEICNSKNRYITIGKNKDKKFSFDINHLKTDSILKYLLEDFKGTQYRTQLTSKMKLKLAKILGKNREAFAIGDEPLGKIKGNDIELCMVVERPYPPILRRPPYPASLETRKEIENNINELLEMGLIKKIRHN
ncbi:hypothetical protein O181_003358 [Austropuccinia psidii MF-1]|uniref:Uncharacterized protein n=1 Tax=Austropuccinia psidii MF-1 TaxID=1389203 RepID=A0A9Q3GDH4_9BASI|nr:hypothetical protein [Austropuccinia psidii MF-1]